jgi:hypothetical protein
MASSAETLGAHVRQIGGAGLDGSPAAARTIESEEQAEEQSAARWGREGGRNYIRSGAERIRARQVGQRRSAQCRRSAVTVAARCWRSPAGTMLARALKGFSRVGVGRD